ncbi:11547_t:CDS:1, partial [Cetraspora pellucida]
MVSYRYAKANNSQYPNYKPSRPKLYILYNDMNALYLGTMTQYMPIKILNKVGSEEVLVIQSIAPNAKIDYMLEVNLESPIHLYNFIANYSLVSKKQV